MRRLKKTGEERTLNSFLRVKPSVWCGSSFLVEKSLIHLSVVIDDSEFGYRSFLFKTPVLSIRSIYDILGLLLSPQLRMKFPKVVPFSKKPIPRVFAMKDSNQCFTLLVAPSNRLDSTIWYIYRSMKWESVHFTQNSQLWSENIWIEARRQGANEWNEKILNW